MNHKKFIQGRVKRLNEKSSKPVRKTKQTHSITVPEADNVAPPASLRDHLTTMVWPMQGPEASLYPSGSQSEPGKVIDPELESLLSEFGLDSSRRSSESNVGYQPDLQSQVRLAEHPYSPYSDYSDDLFDDSTYSSPSSNTSAGYAYSPPPSCAVTSEWAATCSPPPSYDVRTRSSEWSSNSSSYSTYDQGPPMTPTVSQILESFAFSEQLF